MRRRDFDSSRCGNCQERREDYRRLGCFVIHRAGLSMGCNRPVRMAHVSHACPSRFLIFLLFILIQKGILWDTRIPGVSVRIPVPVQYSAPIRHLLAVSLQRNLPGSQPHAIWFIWGYSDYSMDPLITLLYYLTNCEVILHGFLIVFCQAHRWMSLCIILYLNDAWSLVIPLDRYLIVLCNLVRMLLCREVLTKSTQALKPWIETRSIISFLY